MNASEPCEFGVFQSGNSSENTLLFAVFELGLKTDHIAQRVFAIILAKLHHGIGLAFGMRISQPDRFHRPVEERIPAAGSHNLNRQTALEKRRLLPLVKRNLFAAQQLFHKTIILFPGQRTVNVIKLIALVITGLVPGLGKINAFLIDNRRNGIIKR